MKKLTYAEAYDKIIQAYFKDEVQPMEIRFCFCGTLGKSWEFGDQNYSIEEYRKMESALLRQIFNGDYFMNRSGDWEMKTDPEVEERIFQGMTAALEVLKQIHRERGEDVDGVPEFTKRLLTVKP